MGSQCTNRVCPVCNGSVPRRENVGAGGGNLIVCRREFLGVLGTTAIPASLVPAGLGVACRPAWLECILGANYLTPIMH